MVILNECIRCILFFIYCKKFQEVFQCDDNCIFSASFISLPGKYFFPGITIQFPIKELPNWIPAPIPQYTPAPFHSHVKINNLNPITEDCFNKTNPEIPAFINVLTNAVVFRNGSIVTSNFYFPSFTYYMDDRSKPFPVSFSTYKIIDQAIPLFHRFLKTYYHFIIEVFPYIFCFDKKIIENSVLLHCPLLKNQFNELCSLFNITFKGRFFVRQPVFVKKLYVANSNLFIEFNANVVRHFRHLMIERCNASNLKATQNVYYNRPKNRFILNFNELKIALKNELPNVEFVVPPAHSSMVEQVVFWRKTKFAMMVHGSVFSNFIFMHPNTAYLEFSILACRNAAQKLCQSFGIQIYIMLFKRHCLNRSMYADVPDVIDVVKRILKMLETQDLSLY